MGIFHEVMSGSIRNSQEELLWQRVFPDGNDYRSASGIRIDENSALTIADVFKCIRVRAEMFAIPPKKVFEKVTILDRPGRREAPLHPLYRVIHDRPNPFLTSFRFFEMGSAHLDTWGNWYSYIERGARTAAIRNLWPLQPHNVRLERIDGQLWYWVKDASGVESRFYPDEILHVAGLGYDGVQGYSPVRLMMDALGWSKATERYGARFFKNGARPSGIISVKNNLSPEQKASLKESFERFHTGDNIHRVAVIEGEATWNGLTMPNNEAQFLETMVHQRANIAGLYRLPPHMIGDPNPVSDNNVENLNIQVITAAVQPNVERCEQDFERALLSDKEQERYFIEFELKGFLRGDTAARTAFYKEMFNTGSYSQNKILEEENEEPFEGGDEHWIQLNMIPIRLAVKMQSQAQETPNPKQSLESQVLAELQSRVRLGYTPVFRDAIGRLISRKKEQRESTCVGMFRHLVVSLAEMLCSEDAEFIDRYVAAMGKRSLDWTIENADVITVDELNRAIQALMENANVSQVA